MKYLILGILIFVSANSWAAKIYQCKNTNTGITSFQSKPCAVDEQQKQKHYTSKKVSSDQLCHSLCSSDYQICLSHLKGGYNNSDGGTQLCRNEKNSCKIACTDPKKAFYLTKHNLKMRDNYSAKSTTIKKTNHRKSFNSKKTSKKCKPISRKEARNMAVRFKFSAHTHYDDLNRAQKERVRRTEQKFIRDSCSS